MTRLLLVLGLLLLAPSAARGADHHGEFGKWLKHAAGTWKYDFEQTVDGTTTVQKDCVADVQPKIDGKGFYAGFSSSEDEGFELGGWNPIDKAYEINGYSKTGEYWQHKKVKITEKKVTSRLSGALADGTTYEGDFTGTMTPTNEYHWRFEGKTSTGKTISFKADLVKQK